MPKMTLLDMTQNILSAIDSDEVNSISDTIESTQVAEIIRETYFDLFSTLDLPERKTLESLVPYNVLNPTTMIIPDTLSKIDWIKYDYRETGVGDYRDVKYVQPEEFLELSAQRVGQGNTQSDSNTLTWLTIYNDRNPTIWTSFNDWQIVFDAFNSDVDTTLQQSKVQVWGTRELTWDASDDFIPALDGALFPLLLSESKSVAFINLKQVSSAKEEARARRNLVRSQNDFWRADQRRPYNRLPNYGRPSR